MWENIFASVSTLIGLYSTVPYILAVLRGKTVPHQFTWLVFFLMNGIVFFSQFFAGARASIIINFIYFISSGITLLLSIKYGIRNTSKLDRYLFGFCLLTIAIWAITKNNALAIWLTVLIDISATSMMILKIHHNPFSEDPTAWLISGVAYIFATLTLINEPISVLFVRPIYGMLGNFVLVSYIYWKMNIASIDKTNI